MSTIEEIEGRLAELKVEQGRLEKQRDDLLRQTTITCEGGYRNVVCGAELVIGDLTYIQTHWYEGPHGCTGGDRWHPSGGEFDCPRCGVRNRLVSREHYEKLKHLFGDVRDERKHY
jgi:hypothetical protein